MTLITDPERNDATNNADPTAGAATVRTPTNGDTRDDTRLAEPPSPPTNSAESASNRSGRRRRWPYVAAGLGLAAAGTASAVVLTGDGDEADVAEPMSFRTVSAEVRDLVEFTELDGRMVYADTVALTAATDGVVTEVVADGDSVERGQTVYEINGLPVVAFVGDTPMYRTLGPGATGDDVRLIEANLASLGHHTVEDDDGDPVDTGFVVDDVWDDATTDAVVRWQEDLGVATTGQIAATDLIVIDGSAPVIDVPIEVGERVSAGTPLVELSGGPITSTRHVEHSGEIELAVVAGAPIANGDIVYTVDGAPVTAIVAPDGLERELSEGVEPGEDVMALEEMLLALGHDADGDLDVDDEFDEATTRAVIEWQEDLQDRYEDDDVDVRVDGRVEPSEMYVVDEGEVVGTITAHDDELLASGTEIWSADTSGITRVVESAIDVADQERIAEGDTVDVEFPDGTIVTGTVTDIANSSTLDPTNPDAAPTLAVEIALTDVPASAAELNELDVEVKLVDELAAGATVVPVSALVARGDGTFAVEAVTTDGTRFVEVDPGMFSDGLVEVAGIQAGAQVVVP